MAKQLNNPQASTVYPVTEEWLVESEAELAEIPASAPFGSVAMVLTEDGISVFMKNSQGQWVNIEGEGE